VIQQTYSGGTSDQPGSEPAPAPHDEQDEPGERGECGECEEKVVGQASPRSSSSRAGMSAQRSQPPAALRARRVRRATQAHARALSRRCASGPDSKDTPPDAPICRDPRTAGVRHTAASGPPTWRGRSLCPPSCGHLPMPSRGQLSSCCFNHGCGSGTRPLERGLSHRGASSPTHAAGCHEAPRAHLRRDSPSCREQGSTTWYSGASVATSTTSNGAKAPEGSASRSGTRNLPPYGRSGLGRSSRTSTSGSLGSCQ
jgi:hypothetical protein